jgi:hypothetical protein
MNSNHIEVWREYLVGQMHEQCGVAKAEAQKTVDRWLCSREENATSDIAVESIEKWKV